MSIVSTAHPSIIEPWRNPTRPPILIRQPPLQWAQLFALPALICILRFLPGYFGESSYILSAVYALLGRRQAVVALLLVSLMNNATHAFGGPPGSAAFTRHLTILAAAFSVFVLNRGAVRRQMNQPLIGLTALLCGFLLIHSLLFSQYPVLSTLKVTSFAMASLSLFAAAGGLRDESRNQLELQVLGIVAALAVFSMPLVWMSAGYMGGGDKFSGLVSHAQSFGVMMALAALVAWLNVLTRRKLSFGLLAMAGLCTAYIFLSRARVGGAVLVLGALAGLLVPQSIAAWSRWKHQPTVLWRRLLPVLLIITATAVVGGGFFVRSVRNYLVKYETDATEASVGGALWKSRGGLLQPMFASISRYPLTGIGFGVPTEGGRSGQVVNDPVFDLPIMATVEKGVLPVAIVEELGYPLGLLVFCWLTWLFLVAARGGAIAIGIYTGALAANLAESMLFSPGGLGLYVLVFVALALTAAPFNSASVRKSMF